MSGLQYQITTIFDRAIRQSEQTKDTQRVKTEYEEIKHCIDIAKYELKNAENNFNLVTDPKLIDMYIYKIQSAKEHYEHLLKQAKELNIN